MLSNEHRGGGKNPKKEEKHAWPSFLFHKRLSRHSLLVPCLNFYTVYAIGLIYTAETVACMPISCEGRLGDRMLMTIRAPTIQKRENLPSAPPQELQKRLRRGPPRPTT